MERGENQSIQPVKEKLNKYLTRTVTVATCHTRQTQSGNPAPDLTEGGSQARAQAVRIIAHCDQESEVTVTGRQPPRGWT